MTAPVQMRIDTLTIHASSAHEARSLADALPAALERALTAQSVTRETVAGDRGVIDAGTVTRSTGLADTVAQRIVDAAFAREQRR